MATVTVTEPFDPPSSADGDARRVQELGYEQELKRGMGIFDSVAMGFATISPVVGLYAVVLVGMVVAGGAWLWVLPVAPAGQCLLLSVYSELAAKYPLSNGAYQWNRRLIGQRYQGVLSRTRARIVLNVLAVAWLAFETVNVAWPRTSLAPLDAPWYQVWAAPMVVGAIALAGLAYLFTARPTDGR
jgi:amino acid transporter